MKSIIAAILFALTSAVSSWAITIPTVPVGDVGNPNDPGTGNLFGGVAYAYNIGTTEVTVGQYIAFLNAVAAADPYGLYNSAMSSSPNSPGISRSGVSGGYTYSAIGSANYPVTFVSWGDAARFTNWLTNGQPNGAEGSATTETGAYTLNGATSNSALQTIKRNPGAGWFIPTESEWYKAAFYQPAMAGGDSDGYWATPMKTNLLPYSAPPPGSAAPSATRVGNFNQDDGVANGYDNGYAVTGSPSYSFAQNYLTDVGSYTSASTYYGTFDQGGNVCEWTEAVAFNVFRVVHDSSWDLGAASLLAGSGDYFPPTFEASDFGFRVANISIPEPSTMAILAIGLLGFASHRRRPTSHSRV